MISYNSLIQLQIPSSEQYVEDFIDTIRSLTEEIEQEYLQTLSKVGLNFVDSSTVLITLDYEEEWQLYEVVGFLASSLYREGFGHFSFLINDLEYDV